MSVIFFADCRWLVNPIRTFHNLFFLLLLLLFVAVENIPEEVLELTGQAAVSSTSTEGRFKKCDA